MMEVKKMALSEEAVKLHGEGLNCAQCVLMASGKYTGLDPETAKRIAGGFGGGVRSGEICGAISGAVMALGLLEDEKAKLAGAARQCVDAYRASYGCVRCQDLKRAGVSCDELIAYGAEYVENYRLKKEKD